ncbi:MAG: nicotinate (nicotinamide) nucleotide adenylyltransferase [Flavobacteriales bacterium]|nr:nicotinate (nicotinamide) nucleotide adenylyltransferase [Flavobacteriales bacterium]
MTGHTNKGKVGLYFGSFNPIHLGHLIIANHMLIRTDLDEIWVVVTPSSPFKLHTEMIAEQHRLQMVKLAVSENPSIFASDVEFNLDRPSYTVDTLRFLREKFPQNDFSVILGEDNYQNLHKWKNYSEIIDRHRLLIYPRRLDASPVSREDNIASNKAVLYTKAPMIEISSTYIREAILNQQDVQYLLPDSVISYIGNNHLYE